MSPHAPRSRIGYVATGPGFYIWEETRRSALNAARDLSPPSAGAPEVVSVGKARLKRPRSGRGPTAS